MARFRRLPARSLVVFEAAARLLSFTAAATELGMTQPAVSHHIAMLEAELGTALFRRLRRGVELTADGSHLFEAVHDGFALIDRTAAEIGRRRERGTLTVATDFGFAAWWLMPRLGVLRARMPGVDVRILTSQQAGDVRHDAADIAIICGPAPAAGAAIRLFPEIVLPVCNPQYLAEQGSTDTGLDLAQAALLHLEAAEPGRWMSWEEWFAARPCGARRGPDLSFNNYPLLIQAALLGQGVALGWLPLVDDLLRGGQLAPAAPAPMETARGYFLLLPDCPPPGRAGIIFRDWVVGEAEAWRKNRPGASPA